MTQRIRKRKQRRVFLQTAGSVLTLAALGGSVLYWLNTSNHAPNYAGLTCEEVQKLAKDYKAGRLDNSLRSQVRGHVAKCSKCRTAFEAMGMSV